LRSKNADIKEGE